MLVPIHWETEEVHKHGDMPFQHGDKMFPHKEAILNVSTNVGMI
jgi:hypothetical protein